MMFTDLLQCTLNDVSNVMPSTALITDLSDSPQFDPLSIFEI